MVAQIESAAADGGGGGGGVGGSPPAVDESQDQLQKTKTLICALNFLSRNLPLPPDIFDAVSSIYADDVDVGDGDADAADVDNRDSMPMRNGPGMGSYGELIADFEYSLLRQRSSCTSGSGLTKLKEDRFRSHIQHRLTELEDLPTSRGEDLQSKCLLELYELKLADLQHKVRSEVSSEYWLRLHCAHPDKQLFDWGMTRLRHPLYGIGDAFAGESDDPLRKKRDAQRLSRLEEEERNRVETTKRRFFADVLNAARELQLQVQAVQKRRKQRNDGAWHGRQRQRATRAEKLRLQALKADDQEAYMKMVEESKNERLTMLLGKTNELLVGLGAAVQRQKDADHDGIESLEGSNAEMTTSKTDTPGQSLPEEEEDVLDDESTHDVKTSDLLEGQRKYNSAVHSIQEKVTEQPAMLQGGELRSYQLEGLQWMLSLFNNNLNGILADEMGLGKTIQTIALIAYLLENKGVSGPHLIVAPKAVLPNWITEFSTWAPSIVAVLYDGRLEERKALREDLTGEGSYRIRRRLLLTGTPIQNSLQELWSLLNFLLPNIFNSVENFEEWFNAPFADKCDVSLTDEEELLVIRRLHHVIRPFILRRKKDEVEKFLPGKTQVVLKCDMSAWQKVYYQQVTDVGRVGLDSGTGKSKSLQNLTMQLRKCCNHPYLFVAEYNIYRKEEIVRASGKFELLDRLLPKLRRAGHRVLLFSQMTRLMDILEVYLQVHDFKYLRLDGSTKTEERGTLLKQFNAPDSPYFIVGSIEEVILERAKQKMGIDAKVIQAGLFNTTSTAQERREMLEEIMRKGTSTLGTDVPTEREINRLAARSDEEFWLFEKMDEERRQKERYRSRLMEDHEVPDWAYATPEEKGKGFLYESANLTGKRRRKEVVYADTLSDLQWMKAVENGDDFFKQSGKGRNRDHQSVSNGELPSGNAEAERNGQDLKPETVSVVSEATSEDTFGITPQRVKSESASSMRNYYHDLAGCSLDGLSWRAHKRKRSNLVS
ncbi:hypothetical protein RND71_007830 [Anisodus tanguticus]|uniref:Helicase ATP-binding domain-containing protein n=1 Tax=Anisodus tanguticus TaxID=243964 RepID=A0AAE1VQ39_9SOLA|nr:hypothetical protein RND71_007830 [Anisodus tanguticus]